MVVVADVIVDPLSCNPIATVPAVPFLSHMENVHVSPTSASCTTCVNVPPPVPMSSIASAVCVPDVQEAAYSQMTLILRILQT